MTRLTVNPYTIKNVKYNALSLDELGKLPTHRLLAYYKKHRSLRLRGQCECCGECLTSRDGTLNMLANEYMDHIKEILDTREHVS